MSIFDRVEKAPVDSVFGVKIAFEKDLRKNKVDLGVGIFKNEDLQTPILTSVKRAEEELLRAEKNKVYLPIGGDPLFLKGIEKLVFGENGPLVASIQTVGGTSALRLGGDFLINYIGDEMALSDPTWDNHKKLFSSIGFSLQSIPYYDEESKNYKKEELLEAIAMMKPSTILLLQGCCHNPTGFDPAFEEWKEILDLIAQKKVLPFFDFAYQGFGKGLEEDAQAIRYYLKKRAPFLVASSLSKNFGLYAERVGALMVVAQDQEEKERIESQLKVLIRTQYSNPPCHGAKIAAYIFHDKTLYSLWEEEVKEMRERMLRMRVALYEALEDERFLFLKRQQGMFSYTGLTTAQVELLQKEYAIYMLKEGRINVSGLNKNNLSYVASAIKDVCK